MTMEHIQIPQGITPVFILGIPRSGTTLLQSLLDGHPQLLVDVGESRFFNWFYPLARKRSFTEQSQIAQKYLLHLFNPEGAYYKNFLAHIPHHDVRNYFIRLLGQSPKAPKDFMESYIYSVGLVSGTLSKKTRCWVEKTPYNEYYLETITSWWPKAKFIHLVRDPRDIFASYKVRNDSRERKAASVDGTAWVWKKSIDALNQYRDRVSQENYYVLNYETLVRNMDAVLEEVTDFLGIENNEILCIPTKGGGKVPWGGNAAARDKHFRVHNFALGKWEKYLNVQEVLQIESLLHKEMLSLGYTLSHETSHLRPYYFLRIKNFIREIRYKTIHAIK